ncbi:ISL3 family transposase [Paraflavisolibacter sp. H34]|uniref:ISL3 family transposase n=1 Tax=Huijunlia imazamoxiresistens TaxID=3127457 RepID=UPI00301A4F9D
MVSEALAFGSTDLFELIGFQKMDNQAILTVQSRNTQGACPSCQQSSRQLHSYYRRKINDLPAFGNKVCIEVKARKWYCQNEDCSRIIFTERFSHFIQPFKRCSDRLREKLLTIALLMGGNAGKRLCRTLSIATSSSSLIRLIHSQALPEQATSHALGIDDWAFRKGVNYGTVVVDLEQHRIVDLLPDREAQTVENWFKPRQEVSVVSRDRFSRYASGVSNALPQAAQVADRWHLLKNMGDALKTLLERKRQEIIAAQSSLPVNEFATNQVEIVEVQAAPMEVQSAPEPSPRLKLVQQVREMHIGGKTLRAIARELRISRNTVRKYIFLHEPPKKKGVKSTNLGSYSDYLQARMLEDNQVEVLQLFKEIKAQGYNGGRTILYEYLNSYGKRRGSQRTVKLPVLSWKASSVKVLLCKKEEQLSEKDKVLVRDICEKSEDVKEARMLALKFRDMMENRQGHLLKEWIDEVGASSIRELKGFAKGLLSDIEAVQNALTLPWSNGQVEGQINKLKTVKRQMYGRAGFELLKKRMILGSDLYHQN